MKRSMQGQMGLLGQGGLRDQGNTIDPVSGNRVPPGATQQEVRDDIPAQLSHGEFVFPADVTRYFGLDKLMQMRNEAKQGLTNMENQGQMGGAPVNAATGQAVIAPQVPTPTVAAPTAPTPAPRTASPGTTVTNTGGPVQSQFASSTSTAAPSGRVNTASARRPTVNWRAPQVQQYNNNTGSTYSGVMGSSYEQLQKSTVKKYTNPNTGENLYIPFVSGKPAFPIPTGYMFEGDVQQQREASSSPTQTGVRSARTTSSRDDYAGDGDGYQTPDAYDSPPTWNNIDEVVGVIGEPTTYDIMDRISSWGKDKISNLSVSGVAKSVATGKMFSAVTGLPGMAMTVATELVDIIAGIWNDPLSGQKGLKFDQDTLGSNPTTSSLAGYNSLGIGVDKDGNMGLVNGSYAFKSFSDWLNAVGMSHNEIVNANYSEIVEDKNLDDKDNPGLFNDGIEDFGIRDEINPGLYVGDPKAPKAPVEMGRRSPNITNKDTPQVQRVADPTDKATNRTPGWQTDEITEQIGRDWDVQNAIANRDAADKEAAEFGLPTSTPIGEAIGRIDFDMGSKVNKDGSIEYNDEGQDQLGGWDGGSGAGASGVQGAGSYDYGGQDDQGYGDGDGGYDGASDDAGAGDSYGDDWNKGGLVTKRKRKRGKKRKK